MNKKVITRSNCRALARIPYDREMNISALRTLHLKIISIVPIEKLITPLKTVPSEIAFKFIILFFGDFMCLPKLVNLHGVILVEFILNGLATCRLGKFHRFPSFVLPKS